MTEEMSEICWHVDMLTCRHCLTSLPKGVAKLTNKKWLKMTLRKLICDTEHSPVIIFNDTYHHRYHVLKGLSWPWHYVSHTFWKSGLTFPLTQRLGLIVKQYRNITLLSLSTCPALEPQRAFFNEWQTEEQSLTPHEYIEWKKYL